MINLEEFKLKIKNKYFTFKKQVREELIFLLSHYIGKEYEVDIPSIDYESMLSFVNRKNDLSIVSSTKKAIVAGTYVISIINIYDLKDDEKPEVTINGSYGDEGSSTIRVCEYEKNGGLYYYVININLQSESNKKIYYKCSFLVHYYKPETFSIFKGFEQNYDIIGNLKEICVYPDMEKTFETDYINNPWNATIFMDKVIFIKENMKKANESEEENNTENMIRVVRYSK